jgi:uncharacterized phage protein gp47/JayE
VAGITDPVLWGKTFSELYGQALDQLKADAPDYTALLPADPGIAVLDAQLHQAQGLGEALDRLPAAALVSWLNYLGVIKKGPVAAKGTVVLTLEPDRAEPLLIPSGTRFLTDVSRPSPGLADVTVFVTESDLEIPVGETTAETPVVAERAGSAGNVGWHTIAHVYQTLPYVRSIDNPQPTTGGTDSELDLEALERGRKLLRHHWRAVAPDDYEQIAISVPGIARAKTLDEPGLVRVYLLAEDGQPANDEMVRTVLTTLTPLRVQGVALQVLPAAIRPVDLTTRVRLQVGYTLTAVRSLAATHLGRVLNPTSWTWGRKVASSELLAAIEEVQGVDLVEELLLPHESIVLAPHELAALGTLTVTV